MSFKTVDFQGDKLIMIDQRCLPERERYLAYRDARSVARAIKDMVVRGAPAIGVAAAAAVALGAANIRGKGFDRFFARLEEICKLVASTRPTAVNLFWAVERMKRVALENRGLEVEDIKVLLKKEARNIQEEDIQINRRLSHIGQDYVPDGATVLTHCNAGALACAGYGTALGVIRAAREVGKRVKVVATETRPRMQGARLTCWELLKDGFDVTLICDTMVGHLMKGGEVGLVLVGADRIAANGDVSNKIGTYQLSILAEAHGIPFYVAAPVSTLDINVATGEDIPIEHRGELEVTHIGGRRISPVDIKILNPAFDITPHKYIKAIFTERGAATPPFVEGIRGLLGKTF